MTENHGLDTDEQVFFYEQDFYVLSNFSAFKVFYNKTNFDTAEHAYHCEKFNPEYQKPVLKTVYLELQELIITTKSAHEAFKLAQELKHLQAPNWDKIKIGVMKNILWCKVKQHEYVKRKLLDTKDRILVENSWRDSFWGWGPNKDGHNHLGKLWMEIRSELRQELELDEYCKKEYDRLMQQNPQITFKGLY